MYSLFFSITLPDNTLPGNIIGLVVLDRRRSMVDENPKISASGGTGRKDEPVTREVSSDFDAPLGSTARGRLVFASGATDLRIEATPDDSNLYCAHFERYIPSVRAQNGIVTIHYRRHLLFGGRSLLCEPLASVGLNATIPWEIEFRDGVSRLTADLSHLQVCALDLNSVSTALLTLPAPTGLANIYLSGSASDLMLLRPPGVGLRLQIAGAASHLILDGQYYGACGGGIRWQSDEYHNSAHRYDVAIAGSVSHMTIETR
jgi:hypothetical protein